MSDVVPKLHEWQAHHHSRHSNEKAKDDDAVSSRRSTPSLQNTASRGSNRNDTTSQPDPPPNGGLRAWFAVLGVFFLFIKTWGISSSYGAWQQYYQDILLPDQSPSNLAWVGSIQSFLLVIKGLVTGPLFDLGHFRVLLLVGHLLMVVGLMMTSLCTEYWQLILAQDVCFGLGSGLIYIPGLALVTTLFTTRKPFAVGVLSTGTSIAVVIAILYPEAARRPTRPARKFFDASAYKNPAFTFFSLALFFQFIAFWVPFFYIPSFSLEALGTSTDWAYYILAITNAAGVLSRPVAGFVGHRLGPANVDMFCVLAAAATLFGWVGVTSFDGFIGFSIVWGLFSSVLVSFPAAIVTHPALSPNMEIAGTRLGMSWAAAALGVLVGTPIAGVLVNDGDGTEGYKAMQEFSGAVMVVGGILLIVPLIACWKHRHEV